jgi:hypothetical protein
METLPPLIYIYNYIVKSNGLLSKNNSSISHILTYFQLMIQPLSQIVILTLNFNYLRYTTQRLTLQLQILSTTKLRDRTLRTYATLHIAQYTAECDKTLNEMIFNIECYT